MVYTQRSIHTKSLIHTHRCANTHSFLLEHAFPCDNLSCEIVVILFIVYIQLLVFGKEKKKPFYVLLTFLGMCGWLTVCVCMCVMLCRDFMLLRVPAVHIKNEMVTMITVLVVVH